MDPVTIGLGVAGLMTALGTNAANTYTSNRQISQQKELYQDSKVYNSSIEQVKRLRAAGLNPALAYGTGASEVSAPNLPTPIPNQSPDLGGLASLMRSDSDISNIKANTHLLDTESAGNEIDNLYKDQKNLSAIYHTDMDSWLKEQMSDLTKLDIQYNKLSMNDRLRQLKKDIEYKDSLVAAQDLTNIYLPVKLPQEVQESIARQFNLYKTGQASLKQASAAIMQAAANAHAFDAQYGGNAESRAQFFNASLRALDALGSERMSNSFKSASSAVLGINSKFGGVNLPNPITAGESASYWQDWHHYWNRSRNRK